MSITEIQDINNILFEHIFIESDIMKFGLCNSNLRKLAFAYLTNEKNHDVERSIELKIYQPFTYFLCKQIEYHSYSNNIFISKNTQNISYLFSDVDCVVSSLFFIEKHTNLLKNYELLIQFILDIPRFMQLKKYKYLREQFKIQNIAKKYINFMCKRTEPGSNFKNGKKIFNDFANGNFITLLDKVKDFRFFETGSHFNIAYLQNEELPEFRFQFKGIGIKWTVSVLNQFKKIMEKINTNENKKRFLKLCFSTTVTKNNPQNTFQFAEGPIQHKLFLYMNLCKNDILNSNNTDLLEIYNFYSKEYPKYNE
jgi:hypothetical protein